METNNNVQLIKIAIVDDHKMITDGLERLINESGAACVTGKAYSAAGCRDLLRKELPDVLLLDISMPDGNGIDLCKQIKKTCPQIKIMMLTSFGELTTINAALDAGANGYIIKNALPEELLDGIRTVAAGKRFLCDEINTTLTRNKNSSMELTRRELELLRLIVEGYTQTELADKMCLGVETIRSYRKTLNLKLDAHNTAQLIQNAKTLKLV